MARKRKSKSIASTSKDSGEDETCCLDKILSLEELRNEHIIACETEECNLQAWLQHEQSNSSNK